MLSQSINRNDLRRLMALLSTEDQLQSMFSIGEEERITLSFVAVCGVIMRFSRCVALLRNVDERWIVILA